MTIARRIIYLTHRFILETNGIDAAVELKKHLARWKRKSVCRSDAQRNLQFQVAQMTLTLIMYQSEPTKTIPMTQSMLHFRQFEYQVVVTTLAG